jgi:subtilisin family serine protease
MSTITINGISVDPIGQSNEMSLAGLVSPDSSSSNYILIQTSQPLNRAQKDQLSALGVEILEYAQENTYICHYAPSNLDVVRALPYVDWTNTYLEDFKIPSHMRTSGSDTNAPNLLTLGAIETSMSQQSIQVSVVFHKNVTAADIRDKIAAAARLDPDDLQISSASVCLTIHPQYLEDLAKLDEVHHIEEYAPPELLNNVASGIINANKTHSTVHLEGDGQVIAVCDTGFDKGSTTNVHPAFAGRVQKLYPLGRKKKKKANDPNGHGTHVAGSVLGDGKSKTMGNSIKGTAPKARLVLQSVLDAKGGLGGIPNDLEDLFKVPYQNDDARVHTNSWGTKSRFFPGKYFGKYTDYSSQLDQFVWKHRDLVVCFSAGNEGSDRNANGVTDNGSISPPGTAKNCITVGATESFRPKQSKAYGVWRNNFPVAPLALDLWADNPEGMAAFSSRGPTKNERIKPDITAPGTSILSACSRDAKVSDFWGKSSDPLYAFMGGTSMATPLVAGCAAIVREYFQTKHHLQPSAALVKAMLINGAKDISGQYVPSEAPGIPNFSEGFGRVDIAAAVGPWSDNERVTFKDENTELDTGENEQTDVHINGSDSLLKVTLVWTDPPGEALQNDLDLIVRTADGQERHGNMPPSSTQFDRRNNVEQIVWPSVPTGKVEIVVQAHRVTLHPQSYALVVRVS